MKFVETDERPAGTRAGRTRAELTTFEADVLEAFQTSIRKHTVDVGGTPDAWTGRAMAASEAISTEEQVKEFNAAVQKAAKLEEVGFRFRAPLGEDNTYKVVFWAKSLPDVVKAECPACGKDVSITADNTYRTHGPKENRCRFSGDTVRVA